MSPHAVSVLGAVLACCLVSVAELQVEDNIVVTEDSLQDLTIRTKKSPEKTPLESKSNSEAKAILAEDIKRQLGELKELKRESDQLRELENAYRTLETGFYQGGDHALSSDSKAASGVSSSAETVDDESVSRIARQYNPYYQDEKQYANQNYGGKGTFSNGAYSNLKYQSYGFGGDPYIASQYNPSARTFGTAGIKGGIQAELEVKPSHSGGINPVSVHPGPAVVNLHPAQAHSAPAALEPHKPLVITEHKPHEVYVHPVKQHEVYVHPVKPHEVKVPLFYEKKEIGLPGKFFSKQIFLGPSGDFGSSFSHTPSATGSFSSYPYGESAYPYYAPSYGYSSSYPQGYGYGASYGAAATPYSYPTNSYFSSYPESQNYGLYNSVPYYQGQSYYPSSAGGYSSGYSSRSNREASADYRSYQDELDSLVSQFFKKDSATGEASPSVEKSADQLKEDIEKEQKKIITLQEMSLNPAHHNDGFIAWLDSEVNSMYSRWLNFKDSIMKPKQDPQPKQEGKKDEVKV